LNFALITFHHAPKHSIATFWAYIERFFVSNPFFITELSSIRHSPDNNLLAHGHGEIINVVTGKIIALMTSGVSFLLCAGPDLALATMHKLVIR
jgi:hypothetical protein